MTSIQMKYEEQSMRPTDLKHSECFIVIPARAGSKGIPGKNRREILGVPLIDYSLREANKFSIK